MTSSFAAFGLLIAKDLIPDLVFLGAGSNKVFSLVSKTPRLGCF
jgi:hypothetical protein